MNSFLLAVQFLTIIPINHSFIASNKQLGQSVLYYPVIGLLIGCLLVLSGQYVNNDFIPIQAVLVLIVWVVITGGLHLDGLADCADAWIGGFGNKQRSLDIMKDAAAGPIAVIILVLILLLKWSLISRVLENELSIVLLLTPLLGRLAVLILMINSHYIRKNGLGSKITAYLPVSAVKKTILICLVLAFLLKGILPVLVMCLVVFIIRYLAKKRLGGITGDVYGATVELVEVSVLLSMAI